jgi:hypothetical protein
MGLGWKLRTDEMSGGDLVEYRRCLLASVHALLSSGAAEGAHSAKACNAVTDDGATRANILTTIDEL